MKIIKSNNGLTTLFDPDNITISAPYDGKVTELIPLHHYHSMTDYEFLRQYFPDNHYIFIDFEKAYYFMLKQKNNTPASTDNSNLDISTEAQEQIRVSREQYKKGEFTSYKNAKEAINFLESL